MNRTIAARLVGSLLLACGLFAAATPALADAFIVNDGGWSHDATPGNGTCADSNGKCTLNAAIEEGNFRSGSHTITFLPGVLQVTLAGSLAQLRAPFTITGNLPIKTIVNGAGLFSCLSLTDSGDIPTGHFNTGANGSIIANLVIQNCNSAGISANGHGWKFLNNFIGTDVTGTSAVLNKGDGISISSSRVYSSSVYNALAGIYASFPVHPLDDADIANFSSQLVTLLATLEPVEITGNVLSGNQKNGIEIFSENLGAVFLTGNMIGTDLTGNIAVANGDNGVRFVGSPFGNMVAGNVISGNAKHGISDEAGAVSLPNFIMGNRIGVATLDPLADIGNGLSGIFVDSHPDSSVAHFNPAMIPLIIGPANVISDNKGANNNAFPDTFGDDNGGIIITGASSKVKVIGNTIGLADFPPGTVVSTKAYGNAGDGIIVTTSDNSIGGSPSEANIVAANARHGIVVRGSSTNSTSIVGNHVGVDPALAGDLTIGNGVDGIHINAASVTTIGGPATTDANTIAGNGRNGVKIRNGGYNNGWSNLLQRNKIYGNSKLLAGIGIDLDFAENAENALHGEFQQNYANLDQAQPFVCAGGLGEPLACAGAAAPSYSNGNTSLEFTLQTHGPATFRIELFQIDAATSNAATGMTFLGEQTITTDITGLPVGAGCSGGRCAASAAANAVGSRILMTATDITPIANVPGGGWLQFVTCIVFANCNVNNTSEFSNTSTVAPGAPTVTTNAASALTTTGATLNGTVTANGAQTTVTFEYGPTDTYGTSVAATQSPLAAGASGAPVSVPIAGLDCNSTYHFRVNGDNGTSASGVDLQFTTAACPPGAPTVTTDPATAITTTGATLNGTVSANGAATTVTFEYGPTAAYGSSIAATQSPLPSDASGTPVSAPIGSLSCGQTYHFRVTAANGTSANGLDQSFDTAPCPPGAPTATTVAASAITTTGATLNGTVSSNGAATTVSFEYGPTVAYGTTVAAAESPLPANASSAPVSASIGSLSCGQTYHFRVTAANGTNADGLDLSFQTAACPPGAPTATTGVASSITATGATLNGTVSSNGAQTTVTFEYGTTIAYGTSVAATQSPLADNASGAAVSVPIAGLVCNQTYHFRVNAANGSNASGLDQTFTTSVCPPGAPSATTGAATAITTTGATLNGTVTANGAATTVTFEYGATIAYGQTIGALQSPLPSNASGAAVSAPVAGLTCNTLYHFRVNAANGTSVNGADQTFTTSACPPGTPAATTGAATAVTATGATLNGTVTANGAVTTVTFDYGTTAAYGTSIAASQSPLAAGAIAAAVSVPVAGLACNTTYHFRVAAANGSSANGLDQTFTTSACPPGAPTATTGVATAITAAGATLNGTVTANGALTTVTFEYGSTIAYGTTVAAAQSPLAANAVGTAVSAPIAGLTCGTQYHFRVTAANGSNANGADQTFTTSVCPPGTPTATTGAASSVTAASATLNGTVSANGAVTTVTFEYGLTNAYGSTVAAAQSPLASNAAGAAVSAAIGGLDCGTTYHYRVTAANGASANGLDQTFATSACVKTFSGPTATPGVSATVSLTGGAATCQFASAAFIAAPGNSPPNTSFPFGLFDFTTTGCGPGAVITVQIVYTQPVPAGAQYWKFGPTPGDGSAHWYVMPNVVINGATVTLTITDGQAGDDDLSANGTIVDQGGPGVQIPDHAIPTLSETLLAVLALLMLVLGWNAQRRRPA